MRQNHAVSRLNPAPLWRVALAVLALLCAAQPASAQYQRDTAARTISAQPQADYTAFLGNYYPNTRLEQRGSEFWFVRPPYESQLVDIGGGFFGFTSGWLHGTPVQLLVNEDGSRTINLLSAQGQWYEFARSGNPYPGFDPAIASRLDAVVESALGTTATPGAAIAVSLPGQGTWAGARGLADTALGIPMTPSEHFRLASLSKMFVSVVTLQLAQEGVLSLDQSVEQWLPGMVPNGRRISIRQLLNHTSGLYDYLSDSFAYAALDTPERVWQPGELVAAATSHKPTFSPGAAGRWSYSNTNYVLLGMIIEQATGETLAGQIHGRALDPLGMHNTFFEPTNNPGTLMHSYVKGIDRTNINMSFAWGAGSMSSTVGDLDLFARALFEGRLLSAESMAQMQGFVDTKGMLGRTGQRYGLGLIEDRFGTPKAVAIGHTGALIGTRTALWYFPETGMVVAVALNTMKANPDLLMPAILDAVRG